MCDTSGDDLVTVYFSIYRLQPQNVYEIVDKCRLKSGYRNDWKKFEDIKGVIRSYKSKKNRQYNDQKKKGNNDVQNTTQKAKNRPTRTTLKTGS